jgi:hypothetical protein
MNSKTKLYSQLKPQAIKLRKQGKTFPEIRSVVGDIPKGTLSNWLKDIELTKKQSERIRQIMSDKGAIGRHLGAQKNHKNRIERLLKIEQIAKAEFEKFHQEPLFIAGLVLYLAEGSKKSEQFQFMNSDPKLVNYMILWVTKFCQQDIDNLRFRLYIHKPYSNENCEDFWSKELKVRPSQFLKTIYKPTGRVNKKNPQYKGCLRLEVSGSESYWKTMAWRDCFYATLK